MSNDEPAEKNSVGKLQELCVVHLWPQLNYNCFYKNIKKQDSYISVTCTLKINIDLKVN